MELVPVGSPLDSVPEAGTSNILKSLWFPTSTTPTRKSGQIVYRCAFLLGKQWGFPLFVFWNGQDGVRMCILSVKESGRYDGPSWCWWFQGGVWPEVLASLASGSSLFSSSLTLAVLLLSILSLVLAQWPRRVFSGDPALTTVAVLLLLLITGVTAIIWRQPQSPRPLMFRVCDLCVQSVYVQWRRSACFETSTSLAGPGKKRSCWNLWTPPWSTLSAYKPGSIGTEHKAWPTKVRVSLSDIWAVFRDELTLPTGPCSACPPAGQHLREPLLDDADDLWGLDPLWHLECHWWVTFWAEEAWVTEPNLLPTTSPLNCVRHQNRRLTGYS